MTIVRMYGLTDILVLFLRERKVPFLAVVYLRNRQTSCPRTERLQCLEKKSCWRFAYLWIWFKVSRLSIAVLCRDIFEMSKIVIR